MEIRKTYKELVKENRELKTTNIKLKKLLVLIKENLKKYT